MAQAYNPSPMNSKLHSKTLSKGFGGQEKHKGNKREREKEVKQCMNSLNSQHKTYLYEQSLTIIYTAIMTWHFC